MNNNPDIEAELFDAAGNGPVDRLAALLDQYPQKLEIRNEPYRWTLLHAAAHQGPAEAVDLLLRRGLAPDLRESGDNTYPMHWAAAAGRLDLVRRLADAGCEVTGAGDDHQLEIIGWASCWDGCDDEAHRAVVDFLVSRGARHHIFSAIALGLDLEVRRIATADPSQLERQMSRNEVYQRPLQFAVRMDRPTMVSLLLDLGADPFGTDGDGYPAAAYARTRDIDLPILRRTIRSRPDLVAAAALGRWDLAETLLHERDAGALHLMAKRGDVVAIRWLLAHGADPNARWAHWSAEVTPLHLAVLGNHPDAARALLEGGADPAIRDSEHDSDPRGWAEFFGRLDLVQLLKKG